MEGRGVYIGGSIGGRGGTRGGRGTREDKEMAMCFIVTIAKR